MSEKKNVFVGMPSYGGMTASAARGFYVSCSGEKNSAEVCFERGSLLTHSFNKLWCRALTKKHRGEQVDYFAMLHSDIGPEKFWADTLIKEMDTVGLDVLGVVSPIKTPDGYTSIALDKAECDGFAPLCRITMEEFCRLPMTVTADDLGHPLLINTGCWVCRFDGDWIRDFLFHIQDGKHFDQERNEYVADAFPEDWNASRQWNRLGLRIGVTRKVALVHEGPIQFTNVNGWGDKRWDEEYTDHSVIQYKPVPDPDGFLFPHDVDGWLSEGEGKALWNLGRNKRVLEIGAYCGKSSICIAQSADFVLSVDYHDGRGTPKPRNTRDEMIANLNQYGLRDKVTIAAPQDEAIETESFDLVFIDGAHDYESVQDDIYCAMLSLAPGGLIAFHDYRDRPGEFDGRWDPGVTKAVDQFVKQGAAIISRHDSLAVVRPPAAIPMEV